MNGEPAVSMRILVVDDNERVRRGVVDLLAARKDWEVCGEAHDGAEALQKARELRPDLVLLDISMPGMNGLEAARLLRQEQSSAKIVMMSQHGRTQLSSGVIQAGANACVDKSCLATDLVPSIEALDAA